VNNLEERILALADKALHAVDGPGVYRMLDKDGKIIYIGKAKSLKNRVRSYFQKNIDHVKTRALVNRIFNFEVILTKSEAEALILESIQIKQHKPRYNIALKDDKSYPYVMVDENHSFPKLQYVRKPRKGRKVRLFGPFASATSLRSALRTVNRIFRLRDCKDSEFANRSRPCINHQIGICTAPCVNLISVEDYRKDVERSLQVLSGHGKDAIDTLKAEMNHLSENMEFEQAGRVRDQLNSLVDTIERKKTTGTTVEREAREGGNRDVVGWYRKPDAATISLLFVRGGNLVDSSTFHFDGIEDRSDQELLSQFLAQFYLTDDQLEGAENVPTAAFAFPGAEAKTLPGEILLPFALEESKLLQESLLELGHKVEFLLPQKGVKHELILLAEKNAENAFDEKQREKGSIYRVLSELKAKLKLDNYPRRMECYDISNLGDTGIVASRVTFIEGKAEKSLYRHYKIRSTQTQNDFASMREVIERRLMKTLQDSENYEEPPDLLIVDGGRGQLSMAVEVFKDLNITGVDLVSLAKARNVTEEEVAMLKEEGREVERAYERIFKPGRMNPILLSPDQSTTHLLQRIRDEAHRFAIEFQRKQRKMS
jgi:excinuclease ABC subunit C